jgi:hypothetical protein
MALTQREADIQVRANAAHFPSAADRRARARRLVARRAAMESTPIGRRSVPDAAARRASVGGA